MEENQGLSRLHFLIGPEMVSPVPGVVLIGLGGAEFVRDVGGMHQVLGTSTASILFIPGLLSPIWDLFRRVSPTSTPRQCPFSLQQNIIKNIS